MKIPEGACSKEDKGRNGIGEPGDRGGELSVGPGKVSFELDLAFKRKVDVGYCGGNGFHRTCVPQRPALGVLPTTTGFQWSRAQMENSNSRAIWSPGLRLKVDWLDKSPHCI